jgi:hypothetical protein
LSALTQVTEWLKQVQVGTITNTPFDGQRGGPNHTITGWNVTEWRTALRRIQVRTCTCMDDTMTQRRLPPLPIGW